MIKKISNYRYPYFHSFQFFLENVMYNGLLYYLEANEIII